MVRATGVAGAALGILLASLAPAPNGAGRALAQPSAASGIHKIKHVVIIMQENRSFDHYFGTFPGADGILMKDGQPVACVPDPQGACVHPYHDTSDVNRGGPHSQANAVGGIDGGKMDGFVREVRAGRAGCPADDPDCVGGPGGVAGPRGLDVMGYHTAAEIPNYWAYAKNFVLQDHLFEPNISWSLPQHLFMVSAWSAKCTTAGDPMSCTNEVQEPQHPFRFLAAVDNPSSTLRWAAAAAGRAEPSTSGPTSRTCCTSTT